MQTKRLLNNIKTCYTTAGVIITFDKVIEIYKSSVLYEYCGKLGCIEKSNKNNLPAPIDLTENPNGKKIVFKKDATPNSAGVVVDVILI